MCGRECSRSSRYSSMHVFCAALEALVGGGRG